MKKVLLTGLALGCFAMMATAQTAQPEPPTITVSGTAQIMTAPDEATIRMGVMSQGATAAEAQEKSSSVTAAFLKRIASLGIEKERVQTSRINLNPIYNNPRPGENPQVSGYQASNVLQVRISDFSLIGKVIDAGVGAGANNVEGVDFGLLNDKAARMKALREAALDAKAKAQELADALGVEIVSVYQANSGDVGYIPPPRMFAGAEMKMDAMVATPVEPGQLTVTGNVTVRYLIRQRHGSGGA